MRVPRLPAGGVRSALAAASGPTSTTSVGKPAIVGGTTALRRAAVAAGGASFPLTKNTTLSLATGSPPRSLAPWPTATMFGSSARRRPSADPTSATVFDSVFEFIWDCSALMIAVSSRKLDLQRVDDVLDSRGDRAGWAHRVGHCHDLSRARLDPERAGVAHAGEPARCRSLRVRNDHHLVDEVQRAGG